MKVAKFNFTASQLGLKSEKALGSLLLSPAGTGAACDAGSAGDGVTGVVASGAVGVTGASACGGIGFVAGSGLVGGVWFSGAFGSIRFLIVTITANYYAYGCFCQTNSSNLAVIPVK